jgi:hypothetical protein
VRHGEILLLRNLQKLTLPYRENYGAKWLLHLITVTIYLDYRYHCRSLQAVVRTRDGEEGSPLMDMIASSQPDPSEILLNALGEST